MTAMGRVGVLVAAGLLLGCRSEDNFECQDDGQCMLEGVAGYCESVGFCSFPDPTCASNRRYGQLAGDLAETCVPAGGSTGVEAGSSTEPLPTASTTLGSTTSGGMTSEGSTGGETTTTVSSGSTTQTSSADSTSSSGGSSTGGGFDPGCDVGLLDVFDGPGFGPAWTVDDNPWTGTVDGGVVEWQIGPGAAGFSGISEPDIGAVQSVAVVVQTPPTGPTRQVFLQLQTPDAALTHALVLSGSGVLEARANATTLQSVGVGSGRLELRLLLEDADVVYQYREDDTDPWVELATNALLTGAVALESHIAVGSYAELEDDAIVRVDRYLRCLDP